MMRTMTFLVPLLLLLLGALVVSESDSFSNLVDEERVFFALDGTCINCDAFATDLRPDVIINDLGWKRGSNPDLIQLVVTLQNVSAVTLANAQGSLTIYDAKTNDVLFSYLIVESDWATAQELKVTSDELNWEPYLDQEVNLRAEVVFTNPVDERFNGNSSYQSINVPSQDPVNAPDVPEYAFFVVGLLAIVLLSFSRFNKD